MPTNSSRLDLYQNKKLLLFLDIYIHKNLQATYFNFQPSDNFGLEADIRPKRSFSLHRKSAVIDPQQSAINLDPSSFA